MKKFSQIFSLIALSALFMLTSCIEETVPEDGTATAAQVGASAAALEGALNGKHSDGSHRRTCHDSYHHTPYCEVDGVD